MQCMAGGLPVGIWVTLPRAVVYSLCSLPSGCGAGRQGTPTPCSPQHAPTTTATPCLADFAPQGIANLTSACTCSGAPAAALCGPGAAAGLRQAGEAEPSQCRQRYAALHCALCCAVLRSLPTPRDATTARLPSDRTRLCAKQAMQYNCCNAGAARVFQACNSKWRIMC